MSGKSKKMRSPRKSKKQSKSSSAKPTKEIGKISMQLADSSPNPPTLVTFINGMPSSESEVAFQQFVTKNSKLRKKGKVLMGKDESCTYATRCTGGKKATNNWTSKHVVGVFDPSNKTLTVYPTTKMYSLTQGIIGYQSEFVENCKTMSALSYQDKRSALYEAFGSSKKQKAIKASAANRIQIGSVSEAKSMMDNLKSTEEVTSTPEDLSKEDATMHAFNEARRKFLPPYNSNAKLPKDVYIAKLMVDDEAWGQISGVVKACTSRTDMGWAEALTSKGRWPNVITDILTKVSVERAGGIGQIKCALLLKHLLNFYLFCIRRRGGAKGTFLTGTAEDISGHMHIPSKVSGTLFNLFSISGHGSNGKEGYQVTRQHLEKCMVYTLITYVLAQGHSMKAEVSELCTEMKMEVSIAANILREAGFSIRKSKTSLFVTLNVPLKFPPPKVGRR